MTNPAGAKNLAAVEPRGLDAEFGGYAWIPRMLDKARATLAGTDGSFLFGCPVDHTCLARLGVSPELVLELAGRYPQDGDVLRAMQELGIPTAREAWFDGPAVEDELQETGRYLRAQRDGPVPTGDVGAVLTTAQGARQPPAISVTGEIVTVTEGEITFFLGQHQARTVRAGETVWIPARIEYWLQNTGSEPAQAGAWPAPERERQSWPLAGIGGLRLVTRG